MERVIKNLPLLEMPKREELPAWSCGCTFNGPGIQPHYCPVHKSPPVLLFTDTVSGVANLDGYRAWRERTPEGPFAHPAVLILAFAIGGFIGAAIMWGLK